MWHHVLMWPGFVRCCVAIELLAAGAGAGELADHSEVQPAEVVKLEDAAYPRALEKSGLHAIVER